MRLDPVKKGYAYDRETSSHDKQEPSLNSSLHKFSSLVTSRHMIERGRSQQMCVPDLKVRELNAKVASIYTYCYITSKLLRIRPWQDLPTEHTVSFDPMRFLIIAKAHCPDVVLLSRNKEEHISSKACSDRCYGTQGSRNEKANKASTWKHHNLS